MNRKMDAPGKLAAAAAIALLCATGNAWAQSASDITFDLGQPAMYQVRLAVSPGTQHVYCYQADRLQVIGSATTPAGSTISVPIVLPDPVIRCAACNSYGCSSLSPNAAVVQPTDPLDVDQNSVVNVTDMVMCVAKIRDVLY
jgi:hypothetical protein